MKRLTGLILKNQSGFTILEVLVAIVIMGAVSAIFLTANSVAYKSLFVATRESIAQNAAQIKMENVKSQNDTPFDDVSPYSYAEPDTDALTSLSGLMDSYPNLQQQLEDAGNYTISVEVGSVTGGPPDQIQKITVIVKLSGNEVFRLVDYKVNR